MMRHAAAGGLAVLLVAAAALPAAAEDFEPRSGRSYVVRDMGGNLMEKLQPASDAYVRFGVTGRRLGRAVPARGGQLKFYDNGGALVATAHRDAQPPMSMRLRAIAVVQDADGSAVGIVAAR
jgi:hypothetical protein